MFVTCKEFIPVKNMLVWSAVMSCEGKSILLCEIEFSVAFYLFEAVHKFDSQASYKLNLW